MLLQHPYIDFPRITGTEINYYFVCKKKLWLFSRQITMEQNSQRVEMGKTIHEDSFKRENKELLIDDTILIDFSGKELTVHETKFTKALDNASRYQLLYYLFYLEKKGIEGIKGVIHYYHNKSTESITLTDNIRKELVEIISETNTVKQLTTAPLVEKKKICSKCSYYELCYC